MAQFARLTVYNTMLHDGLVPLFYHQDAETAFQIAAALYRGGSHVLEFTNRGDFAIEVFSQLIKKARQELPEMIIGIGSIDDAPTAALYIAHGANFIVGPTYQESIARLCNRRKIGYVPGCGNLNDIANAEEMGVEIVKLFPGKAAGGVDFIKEILAPRPWTRIMPTGGVSSDEDDLRKWFSAGVACVGMGSKLVTRDAVASGDYDTIAAFTRDALDKIAKVRK